MLISSIILCFCAQLTLMLIYINTLVWCNPIHECNVLVRELADTCLFKMMWRSGRSFTLGKSLYIDIGENDIVQDVDSVDPV